MRMAFSELDRQPVLGSRDAECCLSDQQLLFLDSVYPALRQLSNSYCTTPPNATCSSLITKSVDRTALGHSASELEHQVKPDQPSQDSYRPNQESA